MLLLFTGGS